MTAVTRLRVVLDTNQIVAAGSRWITDGLPTPDNNTSRKILIRVAEAHTGLYSGKIVGEYLEKLVDRGHRHDRAAKLLAYIMGAFTRVEILTKQAPFRPTDLDDEIFLLCALDGAADFLVSDDHALVDLHTYYMQPKIGRSADLASSFGL